MVSARLDYRLKQRIHLLVDEEHFATLGSGIIEFLSKCTGSTPDKNDLVGEIRGAVRKRITSVVSFREISRSCVDRVFSSSVEWEGREIDLSYNMSSVRCICLNR